jgi:hypothetical protein
LGYLWLLFCVEGFLKYFDNQRRMFVVNIFT